MSVSIETKALAEKAERLAGQKTLLDWIGSFGSEDIGVDIGTSNVVIYVKHKGVVFPEASVIARHAVTKEFFAYGTKAEEMEGKAPRDIEVVHPMKRSAIIDYNGAAYLLNSIVNQSYLKGMFFHPRLMMCVSRGMGSVQRRALLEAAVAMGARKTVLIDQPIAAMMGLGLTGDNCQGAMIVDMGGGSTKVSVLSKHGIVVSHFSPESGLEMDQAIMAAIRDKYHIRIGRKEVAHAINPILYRIFKNIQDVLQRTPPALLAAIREQGIMLVGGVSQLKGIDELITRITGIAAKVAERPSYVNAIGAGASLNYINAFRDSLQDLH